MGEVEESDGDVLKQETQDLVGLLSSPDPKQRHDTAPAIKMEVHDIKEEVKEENSVKIESNNPANVGKLPNGDANLGMCGQTAQQGCNLHVGMCGITAQRGRLHRYCLMRMLTQVYMGNCL